MSCYFWLLYMSYSKCSVITLYVLWLACLCIVFPIKIIWGKVLISNGPQDIHLTAMYQCVHLYN